VGRALTAVVVVAWLLQMGLLVRKTYLEPAAALAGEFSRYGSGAQWRGIYYKGQKIGFVVGQTVPREDGYELQEDGRLQMVLLGASTAARIRTLAQVDRSFQLRSFSFSLDPGTGAIEVAGQVEGKQLRLTVTTASGSRTETRDLPEPPNLSLNLPRRLATKGLAVGARFTASTFDPATMQNAPMTLVVEARDVVWSAGRPIPAFRVRSQFAGVTTTSWITEVGEIIKEESPMGLMIVREPRGRAMAQAVPGDVKLDMLEAAAVVPDPARRIDDAWAVERLRVRLTGASFADADLQGAGQTASGDVVEVRAGSSVLPGPTDQDARRYLGPEPLIESDAPEIVAEAAKAVQGAGTPRARAERLVRHVNAILEKKPTVSLPSALEVLRTRVGDCNEHTALYVALARAAGIPARIVVGLVYVVGAFYYHAWAEVYLETAPGRGLWLAADPTLNQFPADATHIRLIRGGLDRQAALTQVMGRLKMTILDIELRTGYTPVLVGRTPLDVRPMTFSVPRRDRGGPFCWSRTD
jgi:transglutaminase-like putative cysteine protease